MGLSPGEIADFGFGITGTFYFIFFQASLPDRMYDGDSPLVIFSVDIAMFH